jgi:thioredoxin
MIRFVFLVGLFLGIALSALAQHKDASKEEVEAALKGTKPVILDFWAPWCGPCKLMAPDVERLAKEQSNVTILMVNYDEHKDLVKQYFVDEIPMLLVFRKGKPDGRYIGQMSYDAMLKLVKGLK